MRSRLNFPPVAALARRWRRVSLLNQFMLITAAILLVGALVIGWWINRRIEEDVTQNAVRLAGVFVDGTIAPHIWELGDLGQLSDIQKAHLNQLLSTNIQLGSFVAFNVWRPDGSIAYSNIETPPDFNGLKGEGVSSALRGEIYVHTASSIHGAPRPPEPLDLIEMYFPVRDQAGRRIIAVVEFYQSMTVLRQSILFSQLQSWAVVGVATFFMFVILYGVMKRGSDTIERQTHELAESRLQIQRAAVRAAEVNEAFMRRLGSDLHDGPAQDLGIALMRIEPLREALGQPATANGHKDTPDPETVAFDLELIHTALQSSIREIRTLASGLRLPDVMDLDLAAVVRKSATDYMRKTSRQVTVEGPDSLNGNDALKPAVYRIVQESLNNGYAHGNPQTQTVRFEVRYGNWLWLSVTDDGAGFDPDSVVEGSHRRPLGLAGLQERAEILGGQLHIQSAPGQGTTVEAYVPLEPALSAASPD